MIYTSTVGMTVESDSFEYIKKVFTVIDKAIKNEEQNVKKRKLDDSCTYNVDCKKKKFSNTIKVESKKRKHMII